MNIHKLSIIAFFLNLFFWIIVATYHLFMKSSNPIISFLLFMEPVAFLFALTGYIKKSGTVYYLTLVFLLFNSILSVTDELGVLDLTSLVLNVLLFVMLLLQRGRFRTTMKNEKS